MLRKLSARGLALAILVGSSIPAAASPTMIRLGYPSCAACHVSPQGAGLLTDYGKGIDLAQSIFVREYNPDPQAPPRRFRQDVRALLGYQYTSGLLPAHDGTASTDAQVWHRAAAWLTPQQRLSSIILVDGWPDDSTKVSADPKLVVTKAVWEYRPKDGLELVVGRDSLPSGLENADHQRELRRLIARGARSYPTQAKLFWWTDRVQVTPYVFGPGGDEAKVDRQYGAGALAGLVTLQQHAVIGLSARAARSEVTNDRRVGMYARLGFGKWGILTEHDRIDRSPRGVDGAAPHGYAGLTQIFVATPEWLVLSLGAEYVSLDGTGTYTYRLLPSAQIRVSDKLTFVVGQKDRYTDPDRAHGRSFTVQLFVKTS